MDFFDFSGGGNMGLGSKDSTWRHENKRGQDKAF